MYPTNYAAANTLRLPNAYYDKLPVIVANHHESLKPSQDYFQPLSWKKVSPQD
jgi:hypothetical protein